MKLSWVIMVIAIERSFFCDEIERSYGFTVSEILHASQNYIGSNFLRAILTYHGTPD
jgi:hypothetical protein